MDVIELLVGDAYDISSGLSKGAEYFGRGKPFLSFKTVFNNYFIPSKVEDLVESTLEEQDRCSVRRGDIFLTRTSETVDELGKSCVALKDYRGMTFNGFSKRLRSNGKYEIDPVYIGYYFRSPEIQRKIESFSNPTTRASLNGRSIATLPLKLPSIDNQRHIASILYRLDEKIILNKKINDNLGGTSFAS